MAIWGLASSAAGRGAPDVETPATVGFQELEGGWWYLRADLRRDLHAGGAAGGLTRRWRCRRPSRFLEHGSRPRSWCAASRRSAVQIELSSSFTVLWAGSKQYLANGRLGLSLGGLVVEISDA